MLPQTHDPGRGLRGDAGAAADRRARGPRRRAERLRQLRHPRRGHGRSVALAACADDPGVASQHAGPLGVPRDRRGRRLLHIDDHDEQAGADDRRDLRRHRRRRRRSARPSRTGSPLPAGCGDRRHVARRSRSSRTVARGRSIRRRDPLACLFEVRDPGPFAFGPQGDRVLLGGLQVQGVSATRRRWPPTGQTPPCSTGGTRSASRSCTRTERTPREAVHGRRQGRAALDAARRDVPVDRVPPERPGARLHRRRGAASGHLALDNEGKDPERLVFSRPDTTFSSVAFSPDGTQIWWIAQHAGAISRDPLDGPRRSDRVPDDAVARARADRARAAARADRLAASRRPRDVVRRPAGDGGRCRRTARPAIPAGRRPTQALGWLDARRSWSSARRLRPARELFAVAPTGGTAVLLVNGVDIGAPRTVLRDAPTEVPTPPNEAPPAPPGGVG